jgi:hypothetical protein
VIRNKGTGGRWCRQQYIHTHAHHTHTHARTLSPLPLFPQRTNADVPVLLVVITTTSSSTTTSCCRRRRRERRRHVPAARQEGIHHLWHPTCVRSPSTTGGPRVHRQPPHAPRAHVALRHGAGGVAVAVAVVAVGGREEARLVLRVAVGGTGSGGSGGSVVG